MGRNVRIGGRIPLVVIDAVENAPQLVGAGSQQCVHGESELGGLNLARVRGADGGHYVGVDDAGLEETHLVPELDAFGVIRRPVEPEIAKQTPVEIALIAEIVNRENGLGAEEGGVAGEVDFEIGSEQAGLPVVPVKNVGPENATGDSDGGLAQERIAQVIIAEPPAPFVIDAI